MLPSWQLELSALLTHSSLWSPAFKTNTLCHKNLPQWTFQKIFFSSSQTHTPYPYSLHCIFSSLSFPGSFSSPLCSLLVSLVCVSWFSLMTTSDTINWNDSPPREARLCQTLRQANMYPQRGEPYSEYLSPDCRQQILWSRVRSSACYLKVNWRFLCNRVKR